MKIEIYPSKILSQIATDVDPGELPLYQSLIKNMIMTMKTHRGLGLSAPQVGVNKRIIVWRPKEGVPYVVINPIITAASGKIKTEEGCLSVPNIRKSITRQRIISIEYINENGTPMACDLKNMDAVIVQHEIDHINGLTILSSRKNRRKFDEPKKSQTD